MEDGTRRREGIAGQQNETEDNLLPSSYKAQATAGLFAPAY